MDSGDIVGGGEDNARGCVGPDGGQVEGYGLRPGRLRTLHRNFALQCSSGASIVERRTACAREGPQRRYG